MARKRARLSAEDIVDLAIPGEVSLSPNLKQVVYSVAPSGKAGTHPICSLWIADINEENSARQVTSGEYNDRMPQWSPDGRYITFISDRKRRGETCAIYSMSLTSKDEPLPLTNEDYESDIESFKWSPDGSTIAYTVSDEKSSEQRAKDDSKDDAQMYGKDRAYNRLKVLDVSTRQSRTLYSEDRHTASLAWSQDSKRIAFTTHASPDHQSPWYSGTDFKVATLKDLTIKNICHFPGSTHPIEWLHDGLYFTAGCRPGSIASASALYKMKVEDGCWQRCYLGDINDADGLNHSWNDTLSVKVITGLYHEIHLTDGTRLYSDQQEILGHHFDDNFDVAKDSSGNHVVVLGKSSASTPIEIYSARFTGKVLTAKNLTVLSSHGRAIADHDIGTAQPLSCTSDDGKYTLDAMFVSPGKQKQQQPLPTAVLVHGGPYYHKTDSFDAPHLSCSWAPMILSSGKYGVLVVNYRGNSSYGEDFAAQADGKVGTYEYDDVLTLIDEGIKRGLIQEDRIIIGGWSQGGLISYLAAVRNGKTYEGEKKSWFFKGVIPGAGVTDFDSYTTTSDAPFFGAEMAGGAPWEKSKDDYSTRRGSALWEFAAATDLPPVMILHGELDRRVPISQAVGFHRACLSRDIPCELVLYPREPHFVGERAHQIDMLQRVLRFCDIHLA